VPTSASRCRTTRANFLDWWRDRLRPEIERNFAYLDGYDTENASLVELAVLLEDAIDVHDRHWKIHWMINFAQFSATMALNATIEQTNESADPSLMGRLQSSVEDRNWDSIEALWKMKEEIKGDYVSASRVRRRHGGRRHAQRYGQLGFRLLLRNFHGRLGHRQHRCRLPPLG